MGIELEILIVLSCGCSGLLCGWLLRVPRMSPSEAPEEAAETVEQNQLREVAAKLRQMSLRVAADVDAHQTRIQEVSNVLNNESPDGVEEEAILNAVAGLVKANQQMQQQLGAAQSQIRVQAQAIQSAEELALTDGLTGISNRRAFDNHLEQRLQLDHTEHPTTLMIMDIDHFKKFNDTYGHSTGDEVLKNVANHLDSGFVDVGFVARYGGEEFAVIFDDMTVDQIMEQADTVREGIGLRDFIVDDQRLRVTGSAGLAQWTPGEDATTWIERADTALYAAKESGRNATFWMDGNDPTPVREPEPEPVEEEEEEELSTISLGVPTLDLIADSSALTLTKLQEEGIPFCLLAVRVDREQFGDDELRLVLTSIQASIRGIDANRIGFDSDSTFVVCLPSADISVAEVRATAMVECLKDSLAADAPLRVQVGINCAKPTETFDSLLQRTLTELKAQEYQLISNSGPESD